MGPVAHRSIRLGRANLEGMIMKTAGIINRSRVAAAALGIALAFGPGSAAHAGYVASVIASGLNNPRGLAFGPDGALYVAEGGFPPASGPEIVVRGETFRGGATGSITRIELGVGQSRIISGLPSAGDPATGQTNGPQDIAFGPDGTGYVVFGWVTGPADRALLAPTGNDLGKLWTFTGGPPAPISDVAILEATNPAGKELNSNPFRLAVGPDGILVTDAGSNTLVNVDPVSGAAAIQTIFPPRDIGAGFPSDSVPTGVAIGPDGAIYVAELTGFPFTVGAAWVYRIEPGEAPTVWATGFTNIADIAFGTDGRLYVLEADANGLATPPPGGRLLQVKAGGGGPRKTIWDTGLIVPTGLEIGADGAFYVTNLSPVPGIGTVLQITPTPAPAMLALFGLGAGALVAARGRRR